MAKFSSTEDVVSFTQGAYKPLVLAGSGTAADVWICIRPHVSSAPPTLYAVKIAAKHRRDRILPEVKALQLLTTLPSELHQYYQQWVDHEKTEGSNEDSRWLATNLVEGCSLKELVGAAHAPVPKALVLQIAIQLCIALQAFVTRQPPLVHNDLQAANVMLDIRKRDAKGAPTLVLIDFANGREAKTTNETMFDRQCFYAIVAKLANSHRNNEPYKGQDTQWDGLVALATYVATSNNIPGTQLSKFRNDYETYISQSWESMSDQDRKDIEELLAKASQTAIQARRMAEEAAAESNG